MENRFKIRIAIGIATLAALSLVFTVQYRRRRRKHKFSPTSCYLHSDPKPQLSFKRVLADNSFSQFKHLKFNAEDSSNSHPYESEIAALIENPGLDNTFDLNTKPELKRRDVYIWVEAESQLKELADVLSKEKVFGVDTEQHSLRSFLGFTALIQISTETQDYLLDTIALHDSMGILAPVFADPTICKVFHGADNDVLWLQRDFHIYIVNLFDTAKACEVLSKPQKSLAYLLETYCGVATNKLLQREDWRQRPLSAEMVEYAQIDAHYLLYIAGCLIAELKQENDGSNYPEAIRRSNMICLQLYTKEIEISPGESAASSIFYRLLNGQRGSSISSETQDLVRRLCTWRDLMARLHDESLRYVLSDQAIISLADKIPTTPTEVNDIIAQADASVDLVNINSSGSSPSAVVCSHLDDFYYLILDKKSNLNEIFPVLLKKCLGQNGSCPLSVYNYSLLVNYDLGLTNKLVSKQNGFKNPKLPPKRDSRELFVQKFSCKSPVYHNCRIYANDGRLLCYCDRRKLDWYMSRDLAKLVDDNPPAIMLLFEPKGRPEDEGNDFYIQSKKNICVGCGEGRHYLRYRIIPSCYRMHFPEHLKSHRSHDIVLLCVDCHEVAHAAAEKYKRQVAEEFGIPLFVKKICDPKEVPRFPGTPSSFINAEEAGVSPLQLHTAAMALLRHGARMPPERREELTRVVSKFYGGREVTQADLEKALDVGMTPHKKRRYEKKRRSSSKCSNGHGLSNKPLLTAAGAMATSANENASNFETMDHFETTEFEPPDTNDQQCFTAIDNRENGICSNMRVERGVSTAVCNNMHSDENGVPDAEDVTGNAEDCKKDPSDTLDLCLTSNGGSSQPKNRSKISLLGHGPHGEQVVAHILKESGEDGIHQFCQRWRQIFVEAINPRFLPAGWNVMHSGKRDFGDFSVYKPSNKASGAKG